LTTDDPGQIQRLAAQVNMFITRLRHDEYLLYDNDTTALVLGRQSGRQKTGVSLEQIRRYLEQFSG
jgi:DNA-binding transcriptional MerR regulator